MLPVALLLNPPGSRPYVRDCYCSLVGRRGYAFQPLDLLLQSGFLAEGGYRVEVLDAIATGASEGQVLGRVRSLEPRVVLTLGAAAARDEDTAFLKKLREVLGPQRSLVGSGDLFQFAPEKALAEHSSLDAILTDFACADLVTWLAGNKEAAGQVMDREGRGGKGKAPRQWHQPRPRHELFPRQRYRLPYHPRPFASVLTSYGCPYECTFCNTSQVKYKIRDVINILDELDWLYQAGYRDVYFRDATLGVSRTHMLQMCQRMTERKYMFSWNSFTRADLLDLELLQTMAGAGCRLLQLGIESADPALLEEHRKDLTLERVKQATEACHQAGIAVCGHFVVAWPGRPVEEGAREAANLAVELGCTFASFNVAEPRPGSPFNAGFAQGETADSVNLRAASARNAAMRRFYLDPRTGRRIVRMLRGWGEFAHAARMAGAVLG